MAAKNEKEVFYTLLSNTWNTNERATKIYEELGDAAQDPQIKGALEARAFITSQTRDTLNEVFNRLGVKPQAADTRMQDMFIEDFRKELTEIQSPAARRLFVLAKVSHLVHFRIGQLVALVAAADVTGHYGVGVLLESCLADNLAFAERTRRFIRRVAEEKIAERLAA